MAYRFDHDLEFLGKLNNEELEVIVKILTTDEDGSSRMTETLTSSDEYKKYSSNYSKYWQRIAEEIQTFGGNSFANMFRGGGVKYEEILKDVCDKMKVNYNDKSSTQTIEQNLLMKVLENSISQMNEEELKEALKSVDIQTTSITDFKGQAGTMLLQAMIKQGGFKSYQIAVIIANAVSKAILGRGLTFAANSSLTKAMSVFAGPIGWAITGIWTAIDLAGPAYRITVPIAIEIACLRIISQEEKQS